MMNKPILYTQTDCPESAAASFQVREWLTRHGVVFTERNVTGDLDAAKALYATGVFATPLLHVANVNVLGFRANELARVLGLAQLAAA